MYTPDSEYGAISTLCYGVQWDAIMTYLSDVKVDASSYINTVHAEETDVAKNLYNIYKGDNTYKGVFEWTMEKSDEKKIIRGGAIKGSQSNQTAIERMEAFINNSDSFSPVTPVGFRVALYIKLPEGL